MNKRSVKDFGKIKVIIGIIIFIAVIGFGIYSINVNNNVKAWKDKIYPGVNVAGVNLGGKNEDEAKIILKKEFNDKIANKKLIAKADNKSVEIKYSALEARYDIEKSIKEAMAIGKNSSIYSQNRNIKNVVPTNIELGFIYNKEKVKVFGEQLKAKVNKTPKNANLTIVDGNMNITNGVIGRKINDKKMIDVINSSINGKSFKDTSVDIPVENQPPKITREELLKVNGIIGSFSTDFPSDQKQGREQTLRLGTSKVNGKLVVSGEVFSFNDTVGERTAAAGFGTGAIFKGKKIVDEVGGGICQVSTTLYRAVMNSGIRSVERSNHSMRTSYSDYGLDATVYYGSVDYKFKNTYKSPIYIEGYVQNRKVTFNIYGNTNEKGNKTYSLVTSGLKNIGNDKVQITSYFITSEGGKEISRKKVATDIYNTKVER